MTFTVVTDPMKVLVIEDDRTLRESLCEALQLEGFTVDGVENGEAGLRYLRNGQRPCVILLDLMMPIMDGWAFRRETLKDPALAGIPVVVMTAARPEREPIAPVKAILAKPLEMEIVVDELQKHCPYRPC